jgi:hypothetical protein
MVRGRYGDRPTRVDELVVSAWGLFVLVQVGSG